MEWREAFFQKIDLPRRKSQAPNQVPEVSQSDRAQSQSPSQGVRDSSRDVIFGTTSLSGLDEQDGRYHGSQCQLMRQRLLVLKETPLLDSS